MEDYYQILGLEYGATLEEVEKKYNELLNEFDPDKQSEDLKEFFKSEQDRVNEAYTAISDSLKRIHENLEIIDEVQLSYQTLKLSKDATLAEINNKYKLLLDELNPNNHSNDLKNFFKSEQDKITEAYNIIIKFLANQKSNELLDSDSLGINETSNLVDESNLNIHSNLDYKDVESNEVSYSWWKYDDEYITGGQYFLRFFIGSILSLILIGLYLQSVTAYKRAKSLEVSSPTLFGWWGALATLISFIPVAGLFINIPIHWYLWFSNGPGKK